MTPDKKEITTFLNFIDSSDPLFTYTILNTDTKSALVGCAFGTAEELIDHIHNEQSRNPGATLHITLNRTKTTGRKSADIESARVLCVDLDREVAREELKQLVQKYQVQMVVESSPEHYHLYWKLFPTVDLSLWKELQAALAFELRADLNLSQVTKTIRVPGVERRTKKGEYFTPRIVYLEDSPEELTPSRLYELFPQWQDWAVRAREIAIAERKTLSRAIKDWQAGKAYDKTVLSNSRNVTLFYTLTTLLSKSTLSEQGAEEEAQKVNQSFDEPLDLSEVHTIVQSALRTAEARKEWKQQVVKEAQERVMAVLGSVPGGSVNGSSHNGARPSVEVRTESSTIPASGPSVELAVIEEPRPEWDSAVFKYDYSTGVLSRNRFCDAAVLERVLQKFDKHVVRVGRDLYLFDPVERVWRRNAYELLDLFVQSSCRDVLQDERFLDDLCKTAEGEYSATKLKAAEAHFTANSFQLGCSTKLKVSPSFRRMAITDFDNEESLLYVGNGVLNMITGVVRVANAADYLLRRTPIMYNENATCPQWEQFIREVLVDTSITEEEEQAADTAEMVSFMQELFGYSLCGSIDEQKLYIHYGSGSNGKSKVLECLAYLSGDYCARLGGSTLSKSKTAFAKEFERLGAKIEGKRTVLMDDLDTASQWNEGIIKGLTSQVVPARRLYEEENDIPNRAKVHIGCNEAPKPEAENFGILRRLCIIPYMVQFDPDADKERDINIMIRAEASGILNWALTGYRRMRNRGRIDYPTKILAAIEEYRNENFSSEGVLETMFERPKNATDGTWESNLDLQKDVEHKFKLLGNVKTPSSEALGRFLRQTLKCPSERRRSNLSGTENPESNDVLKTSGTGNQRVRFYFVKLRYNRQNIDVLLR